MLYRFDVTEDPTQELEAIGVVVLETDDATVLVEPQDEFAEANLMDWFAEAGYTDFDKSDSLIVEVA